MGRKTLAEVRAELEAALGAGPTGSGEVVESLRRFRARGREESQKKIPQPEGGSPVPAAGQTVSLPTVAESGS